MDLLDGDEMPPFLILSDEDRGKIKQKPKPLQCKFRVGDTVFVRAQGSEPEGPYKVETVDVAGKTYTLSDGNGNTCKDGNKIAEAELVKA